MPVVQLVVSLAADLLMCACACVCGGDEPSRHQNGVAALALSQSDLSSAAGDNAELPSLLLSAGLDRAVLQWHTSDIEAGVVARNQRTDELKSWVAALLPRSLC